MHDGVLRAVHANDFGTPDAILDGELDVYAIHEPGSCHDHAAQHARGRRGDGDRGESCCGQDTSDDERRPFLHVARRSYRKRDAKVIPGLTRSLSRTLHRLRSTWLATRTARLNTLRGLLREFGIFIPVGSQRVVPRVRALLSEEPSVPIVLHTTLAAACDEIEGLEANMRAVERQLAALASTMPDAQVLQPVPGVGLITATALVALVADIRRFPSGRHFASFLGLTPREDSSASRRRLGAISKQGDVYVRMLLTHGARSVVWHAKTATPATALQRWAVQTELRRGRNVAAVAVANKLARIIWAVWVQHRPFAAEHDPT
jgi:transposase